MSAELETAVEQRWRSAWREATPEAFGTCCHVDVFYEDPLAREPLEGLSALATHAGNVREAFPDFRIEPAGPAVLDERHACQPWRFVGTHRGEVGGVPATKRFVTLHGVHYLELRGGDVRRARGFFDLYDAITQLGLLPARGSLGEHALLLLRGFGLRPRA